MLSAVVLNRGVQLHCLNVLLDTFDEVVYVDVTGSGKPDVTVNPGRLVMVIINEEDSYDDIEARRLGMGKASGDVIVSTRADVFPPTRAQLDEFVSKMKPDSVYTFSRQDVPLDRVEELYTQAETYQKLHDLLPLVFGVIPIQASLMVATIAVDAGVLEKVPDETLHPKVAGIINSCGNFQIARRDTWGTFQLDEPDATQYNAIKAGCTAYATNFPPIYQIINEMCTVR